MHQQDLVLATHDNRVSSNRPGSRLHYFDVLSTPKFEDFDIEYESGNRWGWLGNGFSTTEYGGRDVTYYLDDEHQSK